MPLQEILWNKLRLLPLSKLMQTDTSLEKYFDTFRKQIIGYDQTFDSPYGKKSIIYTDWTASGRLYGPIEDKYSYRNFNNRCSNDRGLS